MNTSLTKFLLALVIGLSSVLFCNAQYEKSFGVRVGKFASGADFKKFFDTNGNTGIEVFAGFTQEANCGYLGKVFFIKQLPIENPRLQLPIKIIFGVGSHVGFFKDPYYTIKDGKISYYPVNTLSMGIDGNIGFEYNTRKLPFTVGVDAMPYYSFLNPGPTWIDLGVNVRFILD